MQRKEKMTNSNQTIKHQSDHVALRGKKKRIGPNWLNLPTYEPRERSTAEQKTQRYIKKGVFTIVNSHDSTQDWTTKGHESMAWACPCPHLLKVQVTSISWPQWNNMSNEWSNDLWSTQNLNINWLCTHVQTRWLGNPCDTDLDVVWAGFPSMLPIKEFAPGIKNADPKSSTVWVANPCWGTNSFQSMMWES